MDWDAEIDASLGKTIDQICWASAVQARAD